MSKAFVWTKEMLVKEAKKYNCKAEFRRNAQGAYLKASRTKVLDEICSHMIPSRVLRAERDRIWTKEKIFELTRSCKTLREFSKYKSAYNASKTLGVFEEVTAHLEKLVTRISDDELIEIAKRYKSFTNFTKKEPSKYILLRQRGLLDIATAHMKKRKKWTKEELTEIALKYDSPNEMRRNEPRAYNAVYYWKLNKELFSHMKRKQSDRDVFYIWEAVGLKQDGIQVYKIGITSKRLKLERVENVAKSLGIEAKIIIFKSTNRCDLIEKEVLKIGKLVDLNRDDYLNGYSELRALSNQELSEATEIANRY